VFTTQGNSAEAERAYRRGIRLVEQSGTDRDTLALLLLNLGRLYLEAGGRAGQAETIVRRALKLAEESYDSDSEELSYFIYVLGTAQNKSGNRRDARRQFERALLIAGKSRDGNIRRGFILANLAVLCAEDKQWNEARDTSLQALALLGQNLGEAHPELVPAYLNLQGFRGSSSGGTWRARPWRERG
jgi:tetratricopeptide (TPR) repeat protein